MCRMKRIFARFVLQNRPFLIFMSATSFCYKTIHQWSLLSSLHGIIHKNLSVKGRISILNSSISSELWTIKSGWIHTFLISVFPSIDFIDICIVLLVSFFSTYLTLHYPDLQFLLTIDTLWPATHCWLLVSFFPWLAIMCTHVLISKSTTFYRPNMVVSPSL